MSRAEFTLTYDGPALRNHEMNVRDLAPAMLAVGEVFEALNSLYNGKAAEVAVNVRAHEPGCFSVVFDVVQAYKSGTEFLAGTEVTAAINLLALLFGGGSVYGLIELIRKLRGRTPEKIERLTPGMFRLFIDDETYDIPVELLDAYKELRVRRAVEGFVAKPLLKSGIDELRIEQGGKVIARVEEKDAPDFRAPEPETDVVVDDTRRAAYTIRDLSFDEDGTWRLYDGANPIRVKFEDKRFLDQVENDEIRFAKHDVLVCMVHFVQKRAPKGLVNEYTIIEVLEHIPAPRQLRMLESPPDESKDEDDAEPA
jgi:hypothetical protein